MSRMFVELHQYQDIKLRLKKLEAEQAALLSATAIADAMGGLSRLTKELASAEESISSMKRAVKRLEDENAEVRDYLKQSEKKLYGGSISQAKELTQLQQRIDADREAINKTDEKIIELMEGIEEKEAELQRMQQEEGELVQALNRLEESNRLKNAHYEKAIAEAEMEAQRIRQSLSPDILAVFDRLARIHHGIAVATLQGDICSACHISISTAGVQKVKKYPDTLHYCENCGRLIFIP